MPDCPIFRADMVEITAVVGEDAAAALLAAFGGQRLYVPRAAGESHPLTVAVGAVAAAQICENWHGTIIYFPIAVSRRQRILDLAANGHPPRAIAAALMVSERHVFSVLAEARDDRQLSLI